MHRDRVLGAALVAVALFVSPGCKRTEARSEPGMAAMPEPEPEVAVADAGRKDDVAPDAEPECGDPPRVDRKKALAEPGKTVTDGFAFFEVDRPPRQTPDPTAPLELVVRGPKKVAPGAPVGLELTLRNKSTSPRTILAAMDGSFEHWRPPFVDVYAKDLESLLVYRFTHGEKSFRCGNMNPRRPEDEIALAPGKKVDDFFAWAHVSDVTFGRAGKYAVWVVYANCAERSPSPGDVASGAKVFEGVIVSNPITVEVR